MSYKITRKLNLCLFGDAGSGTDTGGEAASTGLAEGENPIQTAEQVDRKAEYGKFKADFKAEFDEEVQKIVKSRLRDYGKLKSENETLKQNMQKVTSRYGLAADDYEGLSKALESDRGYLEQQARDLGVPVEFMEKTMSLEAQVRDLTKEQSERDAQDRFNQHMAELEQQAETLKQDYPNFDFKEELQNKDFRDLVLKSGIDMKTAFEVIHKDEIISGGINSAYEQARKQTVDSIRAKGNRPQENGANSAPAAESKIRASTKAEREALIRRAMRGEHIVL